MHALYLLAAILLEVAGTTCMRLAEGFSRPLPSVLIFVFYGLSFACITLALEKIQLSVAYAIWSGMGTALIALIGMAVFAESMSPLKWLSLTMIVAGVVGLNLDGPAR